MMADIEPHRGPSPVAATGLIGGWRRSSTTEMKNGTWHRRGGQKMPWWAPRREEEMCGPGSLLTRSICGMEIIHIKDGSLARDG